MDSISFNFNMEDQKPIFTTATDTKSTSTETFAPAERSMDSQEGVFSPMAAPFQSRGGDLLNLLEPRPADTAPTAAEIDLMNYRISDTDSLFGDNSHQNYYMGGGSTSRTESVTSSSMQWGDSGLSSASGRSGEMVDTFDFLVKSLSSANNYVSMLTREQLSVLRSIRPSLLYEFLQEVAKVRGDKRMRRALPNECAFCKNNGENEECYSTHALKDWRGRVLCPVLRAFRCPRCGATGDRAHTIKYCPETNEAGSDRQGLSSRRRSQPTHLMMGQLPQTMGRTPQSPPTTPQSPGGAPPKSAWWSAYGIN